MIAGKAGGKSRAGRGLGLQVEEDRAQAHLRPVLGRDQQVVVPNAAQPG
jgi:hypothetical protein